MTGQRSEMKKLHHFYFIDYLQVNILFHVNYDKSLILVQIGRLHCLLPWWADATVDFMTSGGYNVSAQLGQVYL